MASGSTKRRKRSGSGKGGGSSSRATTSSSRRADLGSYVGFFIIWLFASAAVYLTASDVGPVFATGLLTAFFLYVTLCTVRAYAGQTLHAWQRGLVRGPLILTGNAKLHVNDLHHASAGRTAIVVSVAVTAICAVGTALVGVQTL